MTRLHVESQTYHTRAIIRCRCDESAHYHAVIVVGGLTSLPLLSLYGVRVTRETTTLCGVRGRSVARAKLRFGSARAPATRSETVSPRDGGCDRRRGCAARTRRRRLRCTRRRGRREPASARTRRR